MPRLTTPFNHAAELIDSGFSEQRALRQVSGDWESLVARVSQNEADILQLQQVIVDLTIAGYGGVELVNSPTTGNDLGAGWDTLDYIYNGDFVTTPRGVVQDFVNGTLSTTTDSIWTVNIILSLTFPELNQGREIEVRLFNQTQSLGGAGVPIPIARNQPGIYFSASFMIDVVNVNDVFVLQIGNGSTVTGITYNGARFHVSHVSDLGALL